MNISGYIARRYFFSKNSRNAVNIISAISILGVLVGTISLVIVLSAFNGLEQLVGSFYSSFNPDIKISPRTGKYFERNDAKISQLKELEQIVSVSEVLEERVLFTFQEKEHIGSLKGVDQGYTEVTDIEASIRDGDYQLAYTKEEPALVLGAGVAYYLGIGSMSLYEPVQLFVPKTGVSSTDFNRAFSSELAYPTGIFTIQPEFDVKYALTELSFVQELLNRGNVLSALEVKLSDDARIGSVKKQIAGLLGPDFELKDRNEQQAVFMKVMRSESLFTFLVFALILGIASFTIMGSLSMMMLDKRDHIKTLWAMGANLSSLRAVFFKEGMMISATGLILGLLLGVGAVFAQEQFGWVKLGPGYVVDAYPVVLKFRDLALVTLTVIILGGLSSWITSRRLNLSFLQVSE